MSKNIDEIIKDSGILEQKILEYLGVERQTLYNWKKTNKLENIEKVKNAILQFHREALNKVENNSQNATDILLYLANKLKDADAEIERLRVQFSLIGELDKENKKIKG